MKTAKKIQIVLTTTAFSILTIAGFSIKCVYADNKSEIIGEVYTFEEKDNYNFLNSEKSEKSLEDVMAIQRSFALKYEFELENTGNVENTLVN